ncbi:MAG: DUF4412 domain-containing protein [Bacteroidales bacterium]|nr:MAG: DUF4412 domain-containing protein [Bacteroidales bacterium]
MRNLTFITGILFVFFMLPTDSNAGWIIRYKSYDTDTEQVVNYLIYIEDNMVKQVTNDLVTIFDLNDNRVTFLRPEIHMYWSGTLEEYWEEVNRTLKLMIEIEVEKLPEDQQEQARKLFQNMMKIMEDPDTSSVLDVFIRETAEKDTIIGYEVLKYQVFLNGVLKEDIWIAENLNTLPNLDLRKFVNFQRKLSEGFENELFYQATDEYGRILDDYFILKTKDYQYGYQTVNEVVEMREEDFDISEFLPPSNYKTVSLSELGLIDSGEEE